MTAPDPVLLEVQSTYRVHYSASLSVGTEFSFSLTHVTFTASVLLAIPVTSTVLEKVNLAMKSAKACPFITVQGQKFTSNCPNSIAHLMSLPEASGFCST